jgi:hypothetical protein
LTDADVKQIEDMSSSGVNEAVQRESFYYPENSEDFEKLIRVTEVSDKLMKFYMKYNKLCKSHQIALILERLK